MTRHRNTNRRSKSPSSTNSENEGPIKSLRNEWRNFQRWARLARQLKEQPDNEKLKKQVASLKAKLEGMHDRIATHQKQAKALEDKIFTMNKPKARKYVLKKVTVAQRDGDESGRKVVVFRGKPR